MVRQDLAPWRDRTREVISTSMSTTRHRGAYQGCYPRAAGPTDYDILDNRSSITIPCPRAGASMRTSGVTIFSDDLAADSRGDFHELIGWMP